MRIGPYSASAINSTSASTRKIGGVSLPDFNKLEYCTKTESAMSDDTFREAITEQAKKDQAAGKFYTNAVKTLQKQFVSVVSPDRKRLITDGLTQIHKNDRPQPRTPTLLEILLGEVKYDMDDKGLRYAEFTDCNGDHVATYSNGGWTFYGTKAEIARESEFFSIYNEAWGAAEKAARGQKQA